MINLFEANTTASKIDVNSIDEGSPLHSLIEKLNCSTSYNVGDPEESIMTAGRMCDCDDAFLCEHRLQFIVDFIKKNYEK